MPAPIDILAFSPHPDDAELGCGGLLLVARKQGLKTAIVDLSEGECSTRGTPATRQAEKQEAAHRLGLTIREGIGLPDAGIGQAQEHELKVVEVLRQLRPRLVLAPYFEDRHPDHEAAARLIKRSLFFANVKKVGSGQPHRVERLLYYMIHQPFQPSLIFDISLVWEEYQEVLKAYQSQFFEQSTATDQTKTALSDGSFFQQLQHRAAYFGSMIRAHQGEPYFSTEPLAFNSPDALFQDSANRSSYGAFR